MDALQPAGGWWAQLTLARCPAVPAGSFPGGPPPRMLSGDGSLSSGRRVMKVAALLLALPAGLLLSTGDAADAARGDLARLQGTWRRVSAEVNGKQAPEEELRAARLTVSGDRYTLRGEGPPRQGVFKLDPATTPKQLDIVSAAGPNKGKTLRAIYKLEGDSFTYCVALP